MKIIITILLLLFIGCNSISVEDELIGTWCFLHSSTESGTSWTGNNITFRENTYTWKGITNSYDIDDNYIYLNIKYKYTLNDKLTLNYGGDQLNKYYYKFSN